MSGGGEHAFLRRLADRLPAAPEGQVWIGDDAAVLEPLAAGPRLLAATDTLVDGIHLRLDWAAPADIAWKAIAVNVSDIAAMGGRPTACLAAVTLPEAPAGLADELGAGLAVAADRLGCPLVGGDTTTGGQLVITVTVLGEAGDHGAVLRSGATPGDTVLVTGALGGAASALAVLDRGDHPPEANATALHRPMPRVPEGLVASASGATAMIDVSDGLAADLGHVCRSSDVAGHLTAGAIPVAEGATLEEALHGGDDYELCLTSGDPEALRAGFTSAGLEAPVAIGTVGPGAGLTIEAPDGTVAPLTATGWDHEIR